MSTLPKSAFQMLPLSRLHESPTNPRRVFDEAKLLELAASLKAQGLIQPIVARPNADGFEIVAGARRYRAAQLTERVKGKCSRHPRYNPEKDGRAGIRGACSCCFSLYDLYQARIALDAAQREFLRRAAPWIRRREPRRTEAAGEAEPTSKCPRVPDH